VVGNCAAVERSGYQLVDTVTLSRKDRKAYYGPIKARIAELRAIGELDAEMTVVIAEMEKEIEFAEKHGDECGYVFYLLEKQGGEAEEIDEEFAEEEEGEEDEDEDEGEEDEEVDVESVRRLVRRQSGSLPPRAFNVNVAPTNAHVYQRFEQQLIDLIGQVGLERAALVFERIERQVQAMIVSR
jgi:TATA-binding protein-associated factor Taf7